MGNELKPFNQNFGDWFVLHQVYKNIEHRHFTRLVSEMCKVESEGLRRSDTMIWEEQSESSEAMKLQEKNDSEDTDGEKDQREKKETRVTFE